MLNGSSRSVCSCKMRSPDSARVSVPDSLPFTAEMESKACKIHRLLSSCVQWVCKSIYDSKNCNCFWWDLNIYVLWMRVVFKNFPRFRSYSWAVTFVFFLTDRLQIKVKSEFIRCFTLKETLNFSEWNLEEKSIDPYTQWWQLWWRYSWFISFKFVGKIGSREFAAFSRHSKVKKQKLILLDSSVMWIIKNWCWLHYSFLVCSEIAPL